MAVTGLELLTCLQTILASDCTLDEVQTALQEVIDTDTDTNTSSTLSVTSAVNADGDTVYTVTHDPGDGSAPTVETIVVPAPPAVPELPVFVDGEGSPWPFDAATNTWTIGDRSTTAVVNADGTITVTTFNADGSVASTATTTPHTDPDGITTVGINADGQCVITRFDGDGNQVEQKILGDRYSEPGVSDGSQVDQNGDAIAADTEVINFFDASGNYINSACVGLGNVEALAPNDCDPPAAPTKAPAGISISETHNVAHMIDANGTRELIGAFSSGERFNFAVAPLVEADFAAAATSDISVWTDIVSFEFEYVNPDCVRHCYEVDVRAGAPSIQYLQGQWVRMRLVPYGNGFNDGTPIIGINTLVDPNDGLARSIQFGNALKSRRQGFANPGVTRVFGYTYQIQALEYSAPTGAQENQSTIGSTAIWIKSQRAPALDGVSDDLGAGVVL